MELEISNIYSWIVLFLYALANAGAFAVTYIRYSTDPAFFYTRLVTSG